MESTRVPSGAAVSRKERREVEKRQYVDLELARCSPSGLSLGGYCIITLGPAARWRVSIQ